MWYSVKPCLLLIWICKLEMCRWIALLSHNSNHDRILPYPIEASQATHLLSILWNLKSCWALRLRVSLYFNPFRAHVGIQIRTGAERNTPKNHTENVGRERALVMLGIYFAKRYQQQPGTKQNLTLPGWSSIHGPNSFFFAANLSVVGNLFPHSPYQHCIDRRKSQSGSPSFIGIGMVSFSAMCTFTQSSVFFFIGWKL